MLIQNAYREKLLNLNVIYTRSNLILLSRRQYSSWQHIQEDVRDYMTSLGPWSPEQTIEYLREDIRTFPRTRPSRSVPSSRRPNRAPPFNLRKATPTNLAVARREEMMRFHTASTRSGQMVRSQHNDSFKSQTAVRA